MGFADEIMKRVERSRSGYRAVAALIDLYAFKATMSDGTWEAGARLNHLQFGIAEALFIFPGGKDYRACFLGDSVWIVQEVPPEVELQDMWPRFCGHMYALAGLQHEPDTLIGNPGVRVFVSYGALIPVVEPDSWRAEHLVAETAQWFVLIGASEAVVKCQQAEHAGTASGFRRGFFWHESLDEPGCYAGAAISRIPPEQCRRPELYPAFYQQISKSGGERARLEVTPWVLQELA